MNSSNESIPHLDFDLFSKDKSLLAKGTINALHNYGFCVFSNHTIDKNLISNCLNMYQKFFNYSDDIKEIRKRLGSVDLAAIPIGAYEPRWIMEVSHMNPEEAVMSFLDLEASKAIGMSWGTFILTDEPVREPPQKLIEVVSKYNISQDTFFTLKHGETYLDN